MLEVVHHILGVIFQTKYHALREKPQGATPFLVTIVSFFNQLGSHSDIKRESELFSSPIISPNFSNYQFVFDH